MENAHNEKDWNVRALNARIVGVCPTRVGTNGESAT